MHRRTGWAIDRNQPDFPSGGIADVSDYNAGMRGGRVKVRARIEIRKRIY